MSDEFTIKVLRYLALHDMVDHFFFNVNDENELTIAANCSDLFEWGTADSETLTEQNFPMLEEARLDVLKVADYDGYATSLWACRVRGWKPQGAAYPADRKLWPLFDAAGPQDKAAGPYTPEQYQAIRENRRTDAANAATELNRLTERVAELEKERKILIAGLGVYFNVGPCDCEPGVGMICEACTKANEAIEAVNSLKIEGL